MTRRAKLLASLPVVLLIAVVTVSALTSSLGGSEEVRLSNQFPSQPIPGTEVPMAAASKQLHYYLPILPEVSLVDVCTQELSPLTPLQVFVSSDSPNAQSGMTYSNGIWVSVTPVSQYARSIQEAGELPPVNEWFSEGDYPTELATSAVHGKTAWVKELSKDFSCQSASSKSVPNTKSVDGSPVPEPPLAKMFDPTKSGDITWLENGLVIDISGPYSVEQLMALADGTSVNGIR